jgi:hypothetical protein
MLLQILATRFTMREWERERREWERFGQHRLALRIRLKRRGAFILRERSKREERSKRDPPCMLSKWHSCKREAHSKGGGAP